MSSLWIPPRLEHERKAEERREGVFNMVQRFHGVMDYWTQRFRDDLGDDRLEVVFWPPQNEAKWGLQPGRYHILRDNQTAVPTVIPIETPDGAFKEPDSSDVERLRDMDLQNPQVLRAHREAEERRLRDEEHRKAHETEMRQEEIIDRLNAAVKTRVSFNRDSPWTQNMSPAAKRDRATRKGK